MFGNKYGGFSGSEIESLVNQVIEKAFLAYMEELSNKGKNKANYSVEIKDKNGILIQKIDCDKIFKLSNISELRCTLDETYVNGEKVDYLIGVKF